MLLAGVGITAWVLLRGGGEEGEGTESRVTALEQAPSEGPNGLPMRGHVRLEHPSGATADVPAAEVLYGTTVDLKRVGVKLDPAWQSLGDGWEFVSYTGAVIADVTTVDLPSTGDPSERVVVRSGLGLWVELPSEAVSLASGKAGLRVQVQAVPAPWTFALARPASGAPEPSAEEQDAVRVEQLYWTDRQAWAEENEAWLASAAARPVPGRYLASLRPAEQGLPQAFDDIRTNFLTALRLLGAVRDGVPIAPGTPTAPLEIAGSGRTANDVYADGVRTLVSVRDDWLAFLATRPSIPASEGGQGRLDYFDRWLEAELKDFAPWGLDLTADLVASGTFAGLDLRVLVPYGELKWADVAVEPGQFDVVDLAVGKQVDTLRSEFADGQPAVRLALRLYSTRAIERLALLDWLKDHVDIVARWLPVALALARVIPGEVGLSVAWAIVDEAINRLEPYFTGPETPFATMAFEGSSAEVGAVSFVQDMWKERGDMIAEGRAMKPSHGLTLAQFAYSLGMYSALRATDWYVYKGVREVNAGTNGYCPEEGCPRLSNVIPPILLHATVDGEQSQSEGHYPAILKHLAFWRLEYGKLDLHSEWHKGEIGPRLPLDPLMLTPYQQRSWPMAVARVEPQAQAIRVVVPHDVIPAEVWGKKPKDADISEFGATLWLSPPGEADIEIPLKKSGRKAAPGDDPEANFYINAILLNKDVKRLGDDVVARLTPGYQAAAGNQATMPGDRLLRTLLDARITFDDSRIQPVDFTIDFSGAKTEPTEDVTVDARGGVVSSAMVRVQYAEASAGGGGGSPAVKGVYKVATLSVSESGTWDRVLFGENAWWKRAQARPAGCEIAVEDNFSGDVSGVSVTLECSFGQGAGNQESIDLAETPGLSFLGLPTHLEITPTSLRGDSCIYRREEAKDCREFATIDATIAGSKLTGTITWRYRDTGYDGNFYDGTLTISVTASK